MGNVEQAPPHVIVEEDKHYYYLDTNVIFDAIHDALSKNLFVLDADGAPAHCAQTLKASSTMLLNSHDDIRVTSHITITEILCKIKKEIEKGNYSVLIHEKVDSQRLIQIVKDYVTEIQQIKIIMYPFIQLWDKFFYFCAASPVIKDKKGRNSVQDYLHLFHAYLLYKQTKKTYFVTSDTGILSVRDKYKYAPLEFDNILSLKEYVEKLSAKHPSDEKMKNQKFAKIVFRN